MEKLTIKLNARLSVEIAGDKSQDVIRIASFWDSLPGECPLCKSPVRFEYTTPQTYKYYKLKCTGPVPHGVALSERQDGSGMYLDRSKAWEVWRAGHTEDQAAAVRESAATPEHANAPESARGKLIARIQRLFKLCAEKGIESRNKVKLETLGKFTDEQLEKAGDYLQRELDNDVPF